jgi:hypothetical protein
VQENHQNTFSIVEQALVLSGLTDYITCASQNELFHTFQKKADRRGLSTVFMCLSRKWVRFFHKLGPYGKFGHYTHVMIISDLVHLVILLKDLAFLSVGC